MNETYLVTGTLRRTGAIGTPENFQIEKDALSSRNAYVQVRDALYNDGCEAINVIAIKMRCTHCGELHVVVDPNLWLR